MIIDCHGHYTTAPKQLEDWRDRQLAGEKNPAAAPKPSELTISDDELRESIEKNQLRLQRERNADMTIFSPRASRMEHHKGTPAISLEWSRICNDIIHRIVRLFPKNFVGVCQLPQSPGVSPDNCIEELERCVNELGFIGCNLNPDPSGGLWNSPPLYDKHWFKVYEKMQELDVPAMVHVSGSCNKNFHATGAHYMNADTTAFMQFIQDSTIFTDFPGLRFVIPHGGGAVPFHWGRYRGLAQDMKKPTLPEMMKDHIYFDTCVYHQPGINLLFEVVPHENILFGSEMVGAVRGIDPQSGDYYDDTKLYVDRLGLDEKTKHMIYEGNARRVYPRMNKILDA